MTETNRTGQHFITKIIPILGWLPQYRRGYLKNDLSAGLTVAVMLIPQGMAYALLAGLPPIMGLYASVVPLLAYAVLGTSKQLAVGPVALDSLLVASGVGLLASQGSAEYIMLAIILALMVGVVQFLMGVARLGFVVNFLSNPVISGFTSAAAIIIGLSQLKHVLGITAPGSQYIHKVLSAIVDNLGEVDLPTLLIGTGSLVLLLLVKRWRPALPGPLIVVALSTALVWFFRLDGAGVSIVGGVPEGLSAPSVPDIDLAKVRQLLPFALTIAFVGFMEAIAIAKRFASKNRYTVDANQELISLGVANTAAGLFGGYSITGSFSRTAVNAHAGGQTGMASIVTAATIALTLLFLTPLFFYMPKAVLGAIVIAAVLGLIDLREARRLYHIKRSDFSVMLFSFAATLILGVLNGILLSVVASLVMIIRRISRPHIAFLGQIPGTEILRNFKRAPEASRISGLVILRMDASFYFANVSYLKDVLYEAIYDRQEPVQAVIFDASSINEIDSSAASALDLMLEDLSGEGIDLYFTNVKGPVRDILKRSGFYYKLGSDHFFFSKKDAVRHYLGKTPEIPPVIEDELEEEEAEERD